LRENIVIEIRERYRQTIKLKRKVKKLIDKKQPLDGVMINQGVWLYKMDKQLALLTTRVDGLVYMLSVATPYGRISLTKVLQGEFDVKEKL